MRTVEDGVEVGSMVYQELDQICFEKNKLTYLSQNNVGILRSISKNTLNEAKTIYHESLGGEREIPLIDEREYGFGVGDRWRFCKDEIIVANQELSFNPIVPVEHQQYAPSQKEVLLVRV